MTDETPFKPRRIFKHISLSRDAIEHHQPNAVDLVRHELEQAFLARKPTPQTIYVKQKLDRDDDVKDLSEFVQDWYDRRND